MRNYSDFDMTDSLKRIEEEDMSLGPVKEQSHYQLFPEAELMPLERTSSSSFPIAPDGMCMMLYALYYILFLSLTLL